MPLVFAYGSNMDPEHLNEWIEQWIGWNKGKSCTVAKACRARLPGYSMCWNHRQRNGTGAANIVEDPMNALWGAAIEVSDITPIDHKEGFRPTSPTTSNCLRFEKDVIFDDGSQHTAHIYIARETESSFVSPTQGYKDLVLKGAAHFNLPQDYRNTLAAVQTRESEIAMMSYYRWLNSGKTHGHDQDDWLESEAYLNAIRRKCVYCLNFKRYYDRSYKEKSEFDIEHVVHQAFGKCKNNNPTLAGRVCKACNHEFSKTIDIAATKDSYEAFLRARHGLKDPEDLSGQQSRRLAVKYTSADGESGNLAVEPGPQGSEFAVVARPIIKLQRKDDGSIETLDEAQIEQMTRDDLLTHYDLTKPSHVIGSKESGQRLMEKIEAKVKAKAREIGGAAIPSAHQEIIIDEILQRAYSKIAFNYFVFACENKCPDFPYQSCFDEARNSILHGIEPAWGRISNPWEVADLSNVDNIFRNPGHLVMLEYGRSEWNDICLVGKVILFSGYGYRIAISRKCERKPNLEQAHFWDLITHDLVKVPPAIHDKLRGM